VTFDKGYTLTERLQPHEGPSETTDETLVVDHETLLQPHEGPSETPGTASLTAPVPDFNHTRVRLKLSVGCLSDSLDELLQPHEGPSETRESARAGWDG